MQRMQLNPVAATLAAALILGAILPGNAFATGHRYVIGAHRLPSDASNPAVVFGGTPVIPRPQFTITISTNGTVTGTGPVLIPLKSSVSFDLRALVKLA